MREIFTMEMTAAEATCAGCGAVNAIGRVAVYIHAPGTVVRCPACESVLMRIVHGGGRYWLDLSGTRTIMFAEG
jgi:Zn finger protein HypA/HybF involved in hydrogenase expression